MKRAIAIFYLGLVIASAFWLGPSVASIVAKAKSQADGSAFDDIQKLGDNEKSFGAKFGTYTLNYAVFLLPVLILLTVVFAPGIYGAQVAARLAFRRRFAPGVLSVVACTGALFSAGLSYFYVFGVFPNRLHRVLPVILLDALLFVLVFTRPVQKRPAPESGDI